MNRKLIKEGGKAFTPLGKPGGGVQKKKMKEIKKEDLKRALDSLELAGGLEISGNPRRAAEFLDAVHIGIEAIKELLRYLEIGSVQECRSAVDKQTPMEVTDVHCDEYFCPACGSENLADQGTVEDRYCPVCGQPLCQKKQTLE